MIYPPFMRPCGNTYSTGTADMQNFSTNGTEQMQGMVPAGTMSAGALPALPTGMGTGYTPGPVPAPTSQQVQGMGQSVPLPPTVQSTMYTPGFLATQIGKLMRVEFLIGTNGPLVDRVGTLISVGASYILLRPTGSDDVLLCDIYSIKFVTILL